MKIRVIGLIVMLLIIFTGIGIAYTIIKPKPKLKIYNPADLNPELVKDELKDVQRHHRVGDFSFTDQHGNTVTQQVVEGKIYVTDFFFTTCPGICKKMSSQLQRVQEKYINDPEIMILSHTVMPEVDSSEVLNAYAELYGIDYNKWRLLTGDKKDIYKMARESYIAVLKPGDGGKKDFIHTENFVLVDKNKRLRGFYDGTSPDDVDRLLKEIDMLKAEYQN